MSGWHILSLCAVPAFGTLLYLKLVADTIHACAEQLLSLEDAEAAAYDHRRQCEAAGKAAGGARTTRKATHGRF